MCMEPESMVPIVSAKHATQVVLIGDHKQLQPIIKSRQAANVGLSISLFERCANISGATMLRIQYRMVSVHVLLLDSLLLISGLGLLVEMYKTFGDICWST